MGRNTLLRVQTEGDLLLIDGAALLAMSDNSNATMNDGFLTYVTATQTLTNGISTVSVLGQCLANFGVIVNGPVASFVDLSYADGSGGSVASYAWTFGDGGTSTSMNPTHTYAAGGTYTVTETITDTDGNTSTATLTIYIYGLGSVSIDNTSFAYTDATSSANVTDVGSMTLASAVQLWAMRGGQFLVDSGGNVNLNGSGAGTLAVYVQDQAVMQVINNGAVTGLGQSSILVAGNGVSQSSFIVSGGTVQLGASSASTAGIALGDFTNIAAANIAGGLALDDTSKLVLCSAGPTTGAATLNLPSRGSLNLSQATFALVGTITFGAPFVFAGNADGDGVQSYAGATAAGFTATPTGLSVLFTDASYSDNTYGPITARAWDFGDGTSSVFVNPTHIYGSSGTYIVRLTVTDGVTSSTARLTVTV